MGISMIAKMDVWIPLCTWWGSRQAKEYTLAFKLRADVTRSQKYGYQWPQKGTDILTFFKMRWTFRIKIGSNWETTGISVILRVWSDRAAAARSYSLCIWWCSKMDLGPIRSVKWSATIDLHWWRCRCHCHWRLTLPLPLPLGVFIGNVGLAGKSK